MRNIGDCTAIHPEFPIACQLHGHPHRVSHFARGVSEDQMWHMHWWNPRAQHDAPDLKADLPLPTLT